MLTFVRNAVLVVVLLPSLFAFGKDPDRSSTKGTPSDESQIRANVKAFVKAFNARDAKAVANLFAPEAQLIDEDGQTTQGREPIEKTFAGMFADSPQGKIRVDVSSIRFIGTALAVETGRAEVTLGPGDTPDATRYTAVHVKSPAGKWSMGFVRDMPDSEALTNYERLKPLEWMIGDWVDESPDSIVMTSCRWSDSKNFLLQDVHIRVRGRDAMHLTQRIGWDPLTKQIKAWVFDSEGGYGESFWTRDGERWISKATAVRRDGSTASLTNIFTPTDKDSYTWRSTDRIAAGKILPPVEVKVVRKAPEAALSK
jgi:uncharacterized protein (TIGR02246 family)